MFGRDGARGSPISDIDASESAAASGAWFIVIQRAS